MKQQNIISNKEINNLTTILNLKYSTKRKERCFYLKIETKNLFKTETKTSFEGLATFHLKSDIYTNDKYTIVVKTAGLEKIFNAKKLW